MSLDLLPPQAAAALAAGHKIEAIKQLRLAKGMSLVEATAAIDAYERSGMAGLADLRPPRPNTPAKLVIPPAAVEALRRGDWMAAIQVLRQVKGVGLAEAKAALEQLQRQAPHAAARKPKQPAYRAKGLSPGEMPRGGDGNGALWLALLAGAAVVIFWALSGR